MSAVELLLKEREAELVETLKENAALRRALDQRDQCIRRLIEAGEMVRDPGSGTDWRDTSAWLAAVADAERMLGGEGNE